MNTNQNQHASAGWQSISHAAPKKRSSEIGAFMQTARPCRIKLKEAVPIPIYFSPGIPDSLALLCLGASQKHSVKVKPAETITMCESLLHSDREQGNCSQKF
jgi:hypothetical protein